MRGELRLTFAEKTVDFRVYDSTSKREKIIETWKKLYGPGFFRAHIEDNIIVAAKSRNKEKVGVKNGYKPNTILRNPRKNNAGLPSRFE